MAAGINDCIDIGHLQNLLGKDTDADTQVISSPTLVPWTPAKPTSPVAHSHSHDRTGNLQLAYHNSLSYSQVDLGETQVDDPDAIYEFTPDIIRNTPPQATPPPSALLTERNLPLTSTAPLGELELQPEPELELEEPESAPNYFPDAHRFSTPHHHHPKKWQGGNPLSHAGFNGAAIPSRMNMSLTQMFDSVSSPARPRTAGTSLPPTPGAAEATKAMARALSRVIPLPQLESEEEPPCSPTQVDPVVYVSMQQSQQARERKWALRHRSISPVVFNSSYQKHSQKETQKIDSDEDLMSSSEERKRRADKARRKGDEEVKRLFAGVRAKSEEMKKSGKGMTRNRRATKSASPPNTIEEETSDEENTSQPKQIKTQPLPPPTITRSNTDSSIPPTVTIEEEYPPTATAEEEDPPTATAEDEDDVSLPMHKITSSDEKTQVLNSAPQTQYTQLPPHFWELLHQLPTTNSRRTRRQEPPISTIADSQPAPGLGLIQKKTSLRNMVPYNIPVPDFVKETSGLVPMTSSLTPLPSEADSPLPSVLKRIEMRLLESSPAVGGGESPTRKRKRKEQEKEGEVVPCSVEEVGFTAMEEGSGFLSSRPEPDDVDMVGIVADVGAGRDVALELEVVGVEGGKGSGKKKGAKRIRVSGGKELQELPRPKSVPTKLRGKKPKPPARKTRLSIPTHRSMSSVMPETPTPNPASTTVDTDDDADILTSNNPAFLDSNPPPPPPPDTSITAPKRVFAWFRDGKTTYHPATILESDTYVVKVVFDDGTEDTLVREHVRALDLRAGDTIKVDLNGMKKSSWIICGFKSEPASKLTDCRGHPVISVKAKNAGDSEMVDVPVTNIYLVQHMWKHFVNRVFITPASIRNRTPSESFSAPTTPSKGRRPTPMTASFSTRTPIRSGIFTGMLFALSFGEKESTKKSIATKIIACGGKILTTGFEELFSEPDGELVLRPEWAGTGFTAVIADTHSRRAKFLQALALGVPCLAPRWVEDSCRRGRAVEWEYYLLAAGESRYLGCIRSRVLGGYAVRGAMFAGVVSGRRRPLEGQGVMVVGGEKRKPYLFLTSALGARVVKVPNLESARGLEGEWDIVYVDGREKERAEKMWKGRKGVRVVDDEWIVQSLILGRLIDD